MALSRATFLEMFPEFAGDRATTTLIDAKLAAAARRVSAEIWGDLYDDGVAYLAAHLLALSPFGQQARLVAKDGSTTYKTAYDELLLSVTSGYRVTAL